MNHGDGLLITTADGCITTTTGPGRREVNTIASAVGGGPRSSLLSSTFLLAIRSVGILFRITIAIHVLATIATGTIEIVETTMIDIGAIVGEE